MNKTQYVLLCVLSYICCVSMSYLHLSEFWNQLHGMPTFLQRKSEFDEAQANAYSAVWSGAFIILAAVLLYFNITKKRKPAIVTSIIIIALSLLSFYLDSRFYYSF